MLPRKATSPHLWLLIVVDKHEVMERETYRRLPNLLRKYRRIRGLSQRQVAKVLDLNPSRISKWETGSCLPTLMNVLRLSIVYRVLVDALFIDHVRALKGWILENERKFLLPKISDRDGNNAPRK